MNRPTLRPHPSAPQESRRSRDKRAAESMHYTHSFDLHRQWVIELISRIALMEVALASNHQLQAVAVGVGDLQTGIEAELGGFFGR